MKTDNTSVRWQDIEYFSDSWEKRIAYLSCYIDDKDTKVCDIGCGQGQLKKYLPSSCQYIGVDYKKRQSVTYVCDLNRDFPQPDILDDVVFCSGSLEYIENIEAFVSYICKYAQKVICSYCDIEIHPDVQIRQKRGWVNHLSEEKLKSLFLQNGMNFVEKGIVMKNSCFCFSKQTSKKHIKRLLVVDPIFRGSRSFFTHNAMLAMKADFIDIITRTDARTINNDELFIDLEQKYLLYEVAKVAKDFWYKKLSEDNIKQIVEMLVFLSEKVKYEYIYFSGLDEIFPEILQILIDEPKKSLRHAKIIFVEYSANHFINLVAKRKLNMRNFQIRKTFLDLYVNSKIAVLDERVFDPQWSILPSSGYQKRFFFLPDPAADKLFEENYRFKFEKKKKMLLVGTQSSRKGLDDIVGLLTKYDSCLQNLEVILVGRLSKECEHHRNFLKTSQHVVWYDEYVSESFIQRQYRDCDFVALPYTKDFNGSSGVYAYACAYAKPIFSTNHGCIGYRVKTFKLGITYEAKDTVDMFNKLNLLLQLPINEYKHMQDQAREYAITHNLEAHKKSIWKSYGL